MNDWSKIKAGFIEWLKTQDVNYDEKDKDFAPIKYSEQFKLYINKEDGDETTNMDSFTKQLKTEDGKPNTEKTLFDSMVEDYINNLQKDDAVFVAIDGLVTGEKDGKLDTQEKNMFLTKISEAGFDGKIEDLSFEDILASVTKIKKGDTSFLETDEPAGPGPGPGPSNPPGDKVGVLTADQVKQVTAIAGVVKTWTDPQEVRQVSSGLMKDVKINDSLIGKIPDTIGKNDIDTRIGNIDSEISTAQTDFGEFKTQYETNKSFLNQSANIQENNGKAFDAIVAELVKQEILEDDTKIQIESLQTTIATTEEALNNQYQAKDTLTSAIGGIDSQIWNLNALLNQDEATLPQGTTKSSIRDQIFALKNEKQRLTEELAALSEEIVVTKEILDSAYENLDVAYQNVETIIKTKGNLTKEERENYQITVNNQREISKAKKNMDSAKAAMVALDGYIKSLFAQKENLKLKKADLEAKEAARNAGQAEKEAIIKIDNAELFKEDEDPNDDKAIDKKGHLGELSEKGFKQGFEKPAEGEVNGFEQPAVVGNTTTYTSNGIKITATTDAAGKTTYQYEITEGDKTIKIASDTIAVGDVKITRKEEDGVITTSYTVGNKTTTITREEGGTIEKPEATTKIETEEGDKATSKFEVTSKDDGNGNITTTTTSFKADAQGEFTVKDTQTVITKNTEGKTTEEKIGKYNSEGNVTIDSTKKYEYDTDGKMTVSTYTGTNTTPSETTVYSTNAEGNKTVTTTTNDPTTGKAKKHVVGTYSEDGKLVSTEERTYGEDGETVNDETVTLYADGGKTLKAQYNKTIQEGTEAYTYSVAVDEKTWKYVITTKGETVNDETYKDVLTKAYDKLKDITEANTEIDIDGKKYQAQYVSKTGIWVIAEVKEG